MLKKMIQISVFLIMTMQLLQADSDEGRWRNFITPQENQLTDPSRLLNNELKFTFWVDPIQQFNEIPQSGLLPLALYPGFSLDQLINTLIEPSVKYPFLASEDAFLKRLRIPITLTGSDFKNAQALRASIVTGSGSKSSQGGGGGGDDDDRENRRSFSDEDRPFSDELFFTNNKDGSLLLLGKGGKKHNPNKPSNWDDDQQVEIPEPSSYLMLSLSLFAMMIAKQKRKRVAV